MPLFPHIAEEILLKTERNYDNIDQNIRIIKILQVNLARVMQKEVENISEESTQDKYIYTYLHMSIKTFKNSHCPQKTYNCA